MFWLKRNFGFEPWKNQVKKDIAARKLNHSRASPLLSPEEVYRKAIAPTPYLRSEEPTPSFVEPTNNKEELNLARKYKLAADHYEYTLKMYLFLFVFSFLSC